MIPSFRPNPLFPCDWYWTADDGRVYSSKRQSIVGKDDAAFAAWTQANVPDAATVWARDATGAQTNAALQDVLTPYGLFVDLRAYVASARYARETAGIAVGNASIATDRESQALITGAWAAAQITPGATFQFKTTKGFAALSAAQVQMIAAAVAAHIQACFAAEAQIAADIAAGKVATIADVDAAFAVVTA